jgi:hypothetical protein
MSNNSGCCSSGSGCCGSEPEKKRLIIDFLYLDLSVCGRCQGTEKNLDEAISGASAVLKAAGFDIVVNKINISSKELAEKYQFISSPTIKVNGKDIELEVKESCCQECGDLCGDNVNCRVWLHEGVEYNEPPKAMIINAIFKEIYGGRKTDTIKKSDYVLPENLQVFFDGLSRKNNSSSEDN